MQGYAESLLRGESSWDAVAEQKYNFVEENISIETVASHLPPDAVLVEFIKIDDYDLDRDIFLEDAHYWALILHPDGRTTAVDLGGAAQLESEIALNLNRLHASDRLSAKPQIEAMSELYKLVWSPFADQLLNTENVVLSPDAILALVPFGALVAEDNQFLIERFTLYHIASGRELVENKQNIVKKANPPVIVADPDFDAVSSSSLKKPPETSKRTAIRNRLSRLEETITEGEKVQELLGDGVALITDKDASEKKVRTIKSPKVFHLATHGLFMKAADIPAEGLSNEDSAALGAAYAKHVQTLSRSGLALSGINTGGLEAGYEGLLTAFDVAGMDLSGTDLVVLSACDTGQGDLFAGEGVLGLRRSFQIAGAKYVLMSLWPLSDKEAGRQMRYFYKGYVAGKNPVLSLRDTQRKRISRLREVLGQAPPALWGAFTIQGVPPIQTVTTKQ